MNSPRLSNWVLASACRRAGGLRTGPAPGGGADLVERGFVPGLLLEAGDALVQAVLLGLEGVVGRGLLGRQVAVLGLGGLQHLAHPRDEAGALLLEGAERRFECRHRRHGEHGGRQAVQVGREGSDVAVETKPTRPATHRMVAAAASRTAGR